MGMIFRQEPKNLKASIDFFMNLPAGKGPTPLIAHKFDDE